MIFTLITFVITNLLLPKAHSHLGVPISIVVNAISFLVIHLVENGKIVMVDRKLNQGSILLVQGENKSILKHILSNIRKYSKRRISQYGAPYTLFGIFYAINFTYPYFMWSASASSASTLSLHYAL